MKQYLYPKRDEIIRALGQQDYSLQDIASMFKLSKTAIHKIIKATEIGWKSPWSKKTNI